MLLGGRLFARQIGRLAAILERSVHGWNERYDPAKHYMRGPGPKFMEKARRADEGDPAAAAPGSPERP